jgi:hypothetical protein
LDFGDAGIEGRGDGSDERNELIAGACGEGGTAGVVAPLSISNNETGRFVDVKLLNLIGRNG